ncbi:MAG TPA: hypothetical protein VG126_14750 [Thermoleophilaceae bacterium]|nr:hypothetical protein [Thermoleophilaceae bacterium]
MAEIPVACTLSPAQMKGRADEIRALGRHALLSVECGARRATLRFGPGPEVRERVEAIVSAEAECCAFLDFTVSSGEEDTTTITIEAPEDGEAVVRELAYLFSADATVNAAVCTCPSCLNSRNSR